MPELPEVETTRLGLALHILKQKIVQIIVRQPRLRWPVPDAIHRAEGQTIHAISRRGKYLIIHVKKGFILVHLGMSGCLRVIESSIPVNKHDHVDVILQNKLLLRFTDPRRFGAFLWTEDDITTHPLLTQLGPEPLSNDLNTDYFLTATRNTKRAIKEVLMDSHMVVGIGNIYAQEALFQARINPLRAANTIEAARYQLLIAEIKTLLAYAIARGGTTLRDFLSADGKPGYFKQELKVYGRGGEPCSACNKILVLIKQQNRATVYCKNCQK